jgi:GMP synthase (glutamine-hydrolysing)
VRPFLLLSSRAEDVAAEDEYAAFLRCTGLSGSQLHRIRMEAAPLPELDLDAYSGVLIGGGPFNSSDPPDLKSSVQHRVEREMALLLDRIVDRDFPFFGACYGVGTLGVHQGGIIDRTFAEPISAACIQLTPDGLADPLLEGIPAEFDAFVGHKEACSVLPSSAVLLATSTGCPVQMFRGKRNVYATQFHPELDVDALCLRIEVYKDYGYFEPSQAQSLKDMARRSVVSEPPRLLKNFVERYARTGPPNHSLRSRFAGDPG